MSSPRNPHGAPSPGQSLSSLIRDVRELQARAIAPARLLGVVLGGGSFPLPGGKMFVAHSGTLLRIDSHIPAGTIVHVDFGHVPPFDELHAALLPATGWNAADGVNEPWERSPWNGGTGLSNTGASPIDISPLAFAGAVALSVGTDHAGDTITWTHPVALAEQEGIDTSNGHFGWRFHDFGDGVTSGETHFAASYSGAATASCYAYMFNQGRHGADAISVGSSLVTGSTGENALGLAIPDDLAPGDLLVVVSACEKNAQPRENSSTTRPRVFINWGVDRWHIDP